MLQNKNIVISSPQCPGGVERAPVAGPAGEVEQDQAGGEMFHILYDLVVGLHWFG